LAVPVLRYSFGISISHREELQKLDRKMRKLLTIHGQHHPKADVDRLYVQRKQGEKGRVQIEAAYAVEITKRLEELDSKEDPLIQIVRMQQHYLNSTVLQTAKTTQDRSTERSKTNKGKHSKKEKRKMAREEDA